MTALALDRRIPAPPAAVWRALTTDELGDWLWPHAWAAECRVDAVVGGGWSIRSSVAGTGVAGRFVELDAPRRLVMTWRWDDDERESLVTIELAPDGAGTAPHLVHERLEDEQDVAQHARGWSDCLDRLPTHAG